MNNLLEMHEFLLNERRAAALTLLNDVVGGRTDSVEGIKLSVGMASAFLDWAKMSPYGRKYNKLPFNMLFTAAFVWGLDRYVKGKDLKDEYKELKAKAKEMRKNESLDEKRSTPYGELMLDIDAAMKKAIKKGVTTLRYAKDYIQSLERMAKKNAKQFFKDYGDFSEDDWIEDVRYNMANEKVNEIRAKRVTKQMWKKFSDDKRFDALLSVIKDPDDAEEYAFMRWEELPGWMQRDMTLFEKDYSTEQRKEMASKGLALPDGSFPIKNIKDLKNAILSYGRSTDHSEVAKFIAKRAKALGAEDLIPDTENFQKALKETEKGGKYIPYYESFKNSVKEKLKLKNPNDDAEADIDFVGSKQDLKKMAKKYKLDADEYKPGMVMLKGKKKDIVGFLKDRNYDMDDQDVEGIFPELLEKKPKGAPDFHHSDAPDAEGRFRDLSPKKLAAWLIKTRKKDLKKISGSLTQQVVFNRNDDKAYADKMEKTRIEVYKQLGREDLLDKKD